MAKNTNGVLWGMLCGALRHGKGSYSTSACTVNRLEGSNLRVKINGVLMCYGARCGMQGSARRRVPQVESVELEVKMNGVFRAVSHDTALRGRHRQHLVMK